MTWTHTLSGVFLCCSVSAMVLPSQPLPEDGSDISVTTTVIPVCLEVTGPKIVAVLHRFVGNQYYITCKVKAESLKAETTVYWLVNGTFVEEVYPDGRVKAFQKRVTSSGRFKTTLQFTQVLPEDFSTTLTCIALNSAGFDKRTTALKNVLKDHKERMAV